MPWAPASSLMVNRKGPRKEKVEVAMAIGTKYTIREWLIYPTSENNWKEILDKRNVKEAPILKIKL